MKTLATIAASVLTTIVVALGAYNYMPLSFIEIGGQNDNLGAAITTIQGSDTISASRITINDNFSSLNDAKFELTDWYATTSATQIGEIGTITTGTWNADILTVPFGGTSSTTLSSNQVLLGNGAAGIGLVAGFGASGQFLTSNGAATAPSWQTSSIDQGANYTWTGNHLWSANASSSMFAVFDMAYFGATATSTFDSAGNLIVNGSFTANGAVNGVANTASTSVWTSSGTWNKPAGAIKVLVQSWGGGASGARNAGTTGSGGGGGGEYNETWLDADDVGATETITIGAGGVAVSADDTNGNTGGNTTFGSFATAKGGGGGVQGSPGVNDGAGGAGGTPFSAIQGIWGPGGSGASGKSGTHSAGGGGGLQSTNGFVGGNSIYGGGGGGGSSNSGVTGAAGGTSTHGGDGGAGAFNANATAGVAPGGGGGANSGSAPSSSSGAGAAGQMIVTTFF